MITRFLRALFNSNDMYGYTPHPRQVFYSVILMATGARTYIYEGWYWFGFSVFSLGVLLGIAIVFSMGWEKSTHYWETINETIKLMQKITNPEVWEALGFKAPAQTLRIIENLNDEAKHVPEVINIHQIDFIPPVIFQTICDAVLTGAPFSEGEIVERRGIIKSPKFRKFQKTAAQKGWIKANNSKDNRQGFSLTKKGYSIFYQAASNSVKMQLKERDGN